MSPLEGIIKEEILKDGPLTLARFMELALYHPELGYYSKEDAAKNIGRKGDFITSVSIGPLFGRLLAQQFAKWWHDLGKPSPFHLVECGGLDGQLAFDILSALKEHHPDCEKAVHYILVEPLPHLQRKQKERFEQNDTHDLPKSKPVDEVADLVPTSTTSATKKLSWTKTLKELRPFEGIIFGNELLDAFPVHLFEGVNGKWQECCVGAAEQSNHPFKFIHQSSHLSIISKLSSRVRGRVEVCPEAGIWIQDAADKLKKGFILLLDYGLTDEEYLEVERPEGTLRSYRKHQTSKNILDNPGEQDITYHVRWTPLIEEAAKLQLEQKEFIQQGRWLTRIVAENELPLNPSEIRQFQTLSHPEMMGAPFRVLILKK